MSDTRPSGRPENLASRPSDSGVLSTRSLRMAQRTGRATRTERPRGPNPRACRSHAPGLPQPRPTASCQEAQIVQRAPCRPAWATLPEDLQCAGLHLGALFSFYINLLIYFGFLFLFFIFWFLCVALAVLNSLCRPDWPRTQRSSCLCLLRVGLKVRAPLPAFFYCFTLFYCH